MRQLTQRQQWAEYNARYRKIFVEEVYKEVGAEKFRMLIDKAMAKARKENSTFFGESTLYHHINALLPKSKEVY